MLVEGTKTAACRFATLQGVHQRVRSLVEHFRIDPPAGVTAELGNGQQEKNGGRGASSRGFVRRIGFLGYFLWSMQHHLSVLNCPQKKHFFC